MTIETGQKGDDRKLSAPGMDIDTELKETMPILTRDVIKPFNKEEKAKARKIVAGMMGIFGRYEVWPVEFRVDLKGSSLELRVRDEEAWNKMRLVCYYKQYM